MTLRHAGFVGRMAGAGALLLMVPLGGLVAMAEEPTQNPPLVADLSWPLILLQDAHSSSPILGGVIDFTVCTKRSGPVHDGVRHAGTGGADDRLALGHPPPHPAQARP